MVQNIFFLPFPGHCRGETFIFHQQLAKEQGKTPLTQKAFREALVCELAKAATSVNVEDEQCFPEYFGADETASRRRCALCSLAGKQVKHLCTAQNVRCLCALCQDETASGGGILRDTHFTNEPCNIERYIEPLCKKKKKKHKTVWC